MVFFVCFFYYYYSLFLDYEREPCRFLCKRVWPDDQPSLPSSWCFCIKNNSQKQSKKEFQFVWNNLQMDLNLKGIIHIGIKSNFNLEFQNLHMQTLLSRLLRTFTLKELKLIICLLKVNLRFQMNFIFLAYYRNCQMSGTPEAMQGGPRILTYQVKNCFVAVDVLMKKAYFCFVEMYTVYLRNFT